MSGPAYYTAIIEMAKNDDWIVPFLYASVNTDSSTTPIDLTGSDLMMEIRHLDVDHEVVMTSTTVDGGIVITDAVGGAFTIIFTRDQLSQVVPGDYVADLVRLMTNGYQERLIDATVTVVEGVTR